MAIGARHDIDLPMQSARTTARLFDVAREIPASELVRGGTNRLGAGVKWALWPEIIHGGEAIECATTYDKHPRDVDEDIPVQPAFLVWDRIEVAMLCDPASEAADYLRTSLTDFLSATFASELEDASRSNGHGLIGSVEYPPTIVADTAVSLFVALARLEDYLAQDSGFPGMRGVIHLTPGLLIIAVAEGLVERSGDAFVTPTGHLVVADAGHTGQDTPHGGSAVGTDEAWIYATGDIWYARSDLRGVLEIEDPDGGSMHVLANKDRPLGEVAGLIVFDPRIVGAAKVTTASAAGGGDASAANQTALLALADPTLVIEAFTADETIGAANFYHGITVRNTAAGASRVTIHHGANSSAPVIDYIDLVEGETLPLRLLARRLPVPNGIHIEVVSGTAVGTVIYEA